MFGQVLDSGSAHYTFIVGYCAVLNRHVEIAACEHTLASYIDIFDGLLVIHRHIKKSTS